MDLVDVVHEVLNVCPLHRRRMPIIAREVVDGLPQRVNEHSQQLGVVQAVPRLVGVSIGCHATHVVFLAVKPLQLRQNTVALDQFIDGQLETHDFLTRALQVVRLVKDQDRIFDRQRQLLADRRREDVVVGHDSDVHVGELASRKVVRANLVVSAQLCQVFNVINWLGQDALGHFLKERVHVQLSLKDALLTTIVKWTGTRLVLTPDLVVFSGELPAICDVFAFNDVLDEDFFLVLTQLLLLLADVSVFAINVVLVDAAGLCVGIHVALALLDRFVGLCIQFAARTIHDAHQGLLVPAKVDLV